MFQKGSKIVSIDEEDKQMEIERNKEENEKMINEFSIGEEKEDEDMNWGIEKEGEFLNLSGSFDLNQQSFGLSKNLEDIIEESNESECQSDYSSSKQVVFYFFFLIKDFVFGFAE
jgi:replicative superfamily II helicase